MRTLKGGGRHQPLLVLRRAERKAHRYLRFAGNLTLAVLMLSVGTASAQALYTFTTTAVGTGTGSILGGGGGFASGDPVILSAAPDPGMSFAGWFGDFACNGLRTMPPRNITCVGIFNDPTNPPAGAFYVAAFAAGPGSGCVTTSTQSAPGGPITLSAKPGVGSSFFAWGGDCASMAGTNPVTFPMPTKSFVCPATFVPIAGVAQIPASCPN